MHQYRIFSPLIFVLLFGYISAVDGADRFVEMSQDIDSERMLKDIETLSSTHYEGRQAGTTGGHQSAFFIQERFEHLGLLPGNDPDTRNNSQSSIQDQSLPVSTISNHALVDFSFLKQQKNQTVSALKAGSDFLPILDSPSVKITAPIVFVGYGIDDPAHGINDYERLHVQNRIVMFLRGKPSHYPRWLTHEEKEHTARRHGAVGFMTLTGPILNRYEARRGMGQKPLAIYSSSPDVRPLPGIWISGDLGTTLFASQGYSLLDIQAQLNKGKNRSINLGIVATLYWNTTNTTGRLSNVLGILPGADPVLRKEIIFIGAHRDHFGKQAGMLFAGADDNASGTAVMLELARLLSATPYRPARTIVFVSFDGEERGLLGSKLYVKQPSHPLDQAVAMINIDHVGVGNGKLTVGLTRLPKTIGKRAANLANLSDKTSLYGYFPGGDHVPFYEAKVPTATIVSSGKHPHFHQPSDTAKTIQPAILENATRYVLALLSFLGQHKPDDLTKEP